LDFLGIDWVADSTGNLQVATAGTYRITLNSGDGSSLLYIPTRFRDFAEHFSTCGVKHPIAAFLPSKSEGLSEPMR
jgi:hypothetical protein